MVRVLSSGDRLSVLMLLDTVELCNAHSVENSGGHLTLCKSEPMIERKTIPVRVPF